MEPLCHESERGGGAKKCRPFVCAPYQVEERGRIRPVGKVEQCPYADEDDECRTYRDGYRGRKTGPCFPLQVMGCHEHGHHFTVYPMGYDPYGRERLAPVDAGGGVLETPEGLDAAVESEPGCDGRWHGTIFRGCGVRRGLEGRAVAARGNRR